MSPKIIDVTQPNGDVLGGAGKDQIKGDCHHSIADQGGVNAIQWGKPIFQPRCKSAHLIPIQSSSLSVKLGALRFTPRCTTGLDNTELPMAA